MEKNELLLLLEFMDSIVSVFDISRLMERAADFLARKFSLENCTIQLDSSIVRKFDADETQLEIEKLLLKQVMENNSLIVVPSIKKDFILSAAKGAAALDTQLACFPLRKANKPVGMAVLYATNSLSHNIELVSIMIEKFSLALSNAALFNSAQHSAVTDSLTRLYNKAYFIEVLKREVARAAGRKLPTSLLMLDLDNFKEFNDTNGHVEGDMLLAGLGSLLKQGIRKIDIPCRYGGEEFAVVLPEANYDDAHSVAERIRELAEAGGKTTASIGLLTCLNSSASASTMLKEADRALYRAKAAGKNRTVGFIIVDRSLGVIDVDEAGRVGKC